MRPSVGIGMLLLVAAALFLRVGDLASRPLHSDESINATKLAALWARGEYRYDPEEYHGPALYYLALPVARASGWLRGTGTAGPDEIDMRWTAVVAGLLLIGLGWWMRDGLGTWGCWVGCLGLAVSPAFVYFSRYFIHEMPLVLFSALAMAAGWRYWQRPGRAWACVFGGGIGLMYATKETFVFNVAAAGVAWLVLAAIEARGSCGTRTGRGWWGFLDPTGRLRVGDGIAAAVTALIVWAIFYSSFLAHPRGLVDSWRTYWIWLERAGGASPHVHPWWFYWERLGWFRERGGPLWTEAALIAAGLLGACAAFAGAGRRESPGNGGGTIPSGDSAIPGERSGRGFVRFLALYTVLLAGIYCVLPYKTPWCALGFYHGWVLLAGWWVGSLLAGADPAAGRSRVRLVAAGTSWPGAMGSRWRELTSATPAHASTTRAWAARAGVVVAVLAASWHLGNQAWKATRDFAADFRNPHVYAHTSADITNLLDQVREVAAADPAGKAIRINVMIPESAYWPLPWYLRDFTGAGWWDRIPDEPYAPIMVVASRLKAGFEEKSNRAWLMVGLFELRPRVFVELHVEAKLWERFLSARRAARG